MPRNRETAFTAPLDLLDPDGDRLRYEIATEGGAVVRFVVQYEARIGGRHRAVVRYDTAHGEAHRDLLDRHAHVIDKRWLGDIGYKEALDLAERDLRANWRDYRAAFVERLGGEGNGP